MAAKMRGNYFGSKLSLILVIKSLHTVIMSMNAIIILGIY